MADVTPDWAADAPKVPGDIQIDPDDDPVGSEMGKYGPPDGNDAELPPERPEPPTDIAEPDELPEPSDGITEVEADD